MKGKTSRPAGNRAAEENNSVTGGVSFVSLRDPSDNGDAWGSGIADHHREILQASGITASHARARAYRSINSGNRKVLAEIGIVKAVRGSDGLLIRYCALMARLAGGSSDPTTRGEGRQRDQIRDPVEAAEHARLP